MSEAGLTSEAGLPRGAARPGGQVLPGHAVLARVHGPAHRPGVLLREPAPQLVADAQCVDAAKKAFPDTSLASCLTYDRVYRFARNAFNVEWRPGWSSRGAPPAVQPHEPGFLDRYLPDPAHMPMRPFTFCVSGGDSRVVWLNAKHDDCDTPSEADQQRYQRDAAALMRGDLVLPSLAEAESSRSSRPRRTQGSSSPARLTSRLPIRKPVAARAKAT